MSNSLRLCRICLGSEGDGEMIPIFEDDGQIAKKILTISGVQVCSKGFSQMIS